MADGTKPAKELKALTPDYIEKAAETGAKVLVWSKDLSADAIRLAHQKGFKVWVYTIDEEGAANQLLDAEVDGIITNNPAVIWRTLALRSH
jgi:glycerophosphoryl diester phosphodiesterase